MITAVTLPVNQFSLAYTVSDNYLRNVKEEDLFCLMVSDIVVDGHITQLFFVASGEEGTL